MASHINTARVTPLNITVLPRASEKKRPDNVINVAPKATIPDIAAARRMARPFSPVRNTGLNRPPTATKTIRPSNRRKNCVKLDVFGFCEGVETVLVALMALPHHRSE
jgi:hypothetical protein